MSTDLDQVFSGEPTPDTPAAEAPAPVETPVEEPAAAEAPAEPVAEETPTGAEEPAAEPAQEPTDEPAPQMVPLAALQEVRKELQGLKAAMPQPEAPKAPDMHEDPEGFTKYVAQQTQQAAIGTKLETSRFIAEREFGADVVKQAFEFFNDHPEQSQALLSHPSPFHAAVEEFNKHKVAQEIGTDPAAYAAKIRAEVEAEVKAAMVAEQVKTNKATPAPSMAGVTGTGGSAKPLWNGPTSLDSLL